MFESDYLNEEKVKLHLGKAFDLVAVESLLSKREITDAYSPFLLLLISTLFSYIICMYVCIYVRNL